MRARSIFQIWYEGKETEKENANKNEKVRHIKGHLY
jgi:hypothetical protein